MFVIKSITLEDSDWERGNRERERGEKKHAEIYMGQILTIAGSWVLEKTEEMQTMLMNGN